MGIEIVDHYGVLGLTYGDMSRLKTEAEYKKVLKAAYRSLAREYHPDVNIGLSEEQIRINTLKMGKLNRAYGVLASPEKREQYHLRLDSRLNRSTQPTNGGSSQHRRDSRAGTSNGAPPRTNDRTSKKPESNYSQRQRSIIDDAVRNYEAAEARAKANASGRGNNSHKPNASANTRTNQQSARSGAEPITDMSLLEMLKHGIKAKRESRANRPVKSHGRKVSKESVNDLLRKVKTDGRKIDEAVVNTIVDGLDLGTKLGISTLNALIDLGCLSNDGDATALTISRKIPKDNKYGYQATILLIENLNAVTTRDNLLSMSKHEPTNADRVFVNIYNSINLRRDQAAAVFRALARTASLDGVFGERAMGDLVSSFGIDTNRVSPPKNVPLVVEVLQSEGLLDPYCKVSNDMYRLLYDMPGSMF